MKLIGKSQKLQYERQTQMKDIRIFTGKNTFPSFEEAGKLFGGRLSLLQEQQYKVLYQKLCRPMQMRLQPKAAAVIGTPQSISLPCVAGRAPAVLFAMLTIGDSVSRLIETYEEKEDMTMALAANALADGCLFAWEAQLLPILQQVCRESGFGIASRIEIPRDVPAEILKTAYEALDAKRTLNLSITSGHMLNPAKSMCLIFALTKDVTKENSAHDCSLCAAYDCPLRTDEKILLRVEGAGVGDPKEIICQKGDNLKQTLQNHGILLPAFCGGRGSCGKCGVIQKENTLPITPEDRLCFSGTQLTAGNRLSCKAVIRENLTVFLEKQDESSFVALGADETERKKSASHKVHPDADYEIAIDIGTTTLAFSLLERKTGIVSGSHTAVNSQRAYGADVISRIQSANQGKRQQLASSIKKDLADGILTLLAAHGVPIRRLRHIAIAGNTVMLHLLNGYSCEGFSKYPFLPETLALEEPDCQALFDGLLPIEASPKITLLPGISAFVGADIVAGLYACGVLKERKASLLIDLGTNGEMALAADGQIFVASTAAGPVFEGGSIQWGMGSLPGAIAQVEILEQDLRIQTIANCPPAGICGTGAIEAAAELLMAGILDKTGKLSGRFFSDGYPLAKTASGDAVCLTQKDVREIQMAKAAIRAGIETLILRSGIRRESIERVFLAGGFGYYLNVRKAAVIGILPEDFVEKTKAVGNASLKGAQRYLKEKDPNSIQEICKQATEIPLANDETFQEAYFTHMSFSYDRNCS